MTTPVQTQGRALGVGHTDNLYAFTGRVWRASGYEQCASNREPGPAARGPAATAEGGVSDRCAQDLCGFLRLLRGEPLLDTGRIGVGALLL